MTGISVTPVSSDADLQEFLDLPRRLYPDDSDARRRYVPVWHDTVRRWHTGRGPHLAHGPVELVLARDPSGQVVGRSTIHTDTRMDAKLGAPTQLIGLTEVAEPDASATLEAIAAAAEERARASGRHTLLGPCALLPNQVGGVITSGFDERGFVDSPWNPAFVPALWEGLGFERIWEGDTWICEDLAALDLDRTFPPRTPPDGLVLRRGDRRRLDEQLPLLREMLNASFDALPYYTPITPEELAVQTDGLAHLLDESLLLYLEQHGTPVAFVLVLPDLTEFVQSTGGRLALLDQARLLLTKRRYRREAILVIKGTVPSAQGQGLMHVLSRQLLTNLQRGGYRSLRVTVIGEHNAGSRAQFEAMGGRPLHGVTYYRRQVR